MGRKRGRLIYVKKKRRKPNEKKKGGQELGQFQKNPTSTARDGFLRLDEKRNLSAKGGPTKGRKKRHPCERRGGEKNLALQRSTSENRKGKGQQIPKLEGPAFGRSKGKLRYRGLRKTYEKRGKNCNQGTKKREENKAVGISKERRDCWPAPFTSQAEREPPKGEKRRLLRGRASSRGKRGGEGELGSCVSLTGRKSKKGRDLLLYR